MRCSCFRLDTFGRRRCACPAGRLGGRGVVLLAVLVAFFPAPLAGADWPQWRGPNRDGVWSETGIADRFALETLPVKWRAKVGSGYSGPTVANNRVYVTDRVTSPAETERVHCFDAMTGRQLWSHNYACKYERVGYKAGPRAAVTISDGNAYSLGTMAHLFCFDAAIGRVLWSRDLKQEYDVKIPTWGIAAAPLVEAGMLIVQAGGRGDACLVAFDKTTGQERWRALSDSASYSAPIIIEQAGRRVLVCITGERVVGLDPRTGALHWQHPFPPSRMVITIATPVFDGRHLLFSSFYDGSLLLRVDPARLAVEEVWRRRGPNERNTDALHCCISTPVILGEHIYGVDSYGELRCLELQTGDRVWEDLTATPKARWSNIHLVRNGEKTWMFNERGELIVGRLSPAGFDEVSRAKLIAPTEAQLSQRGGVCWAHPAFAYGHVYARNDEEIVCADLSTP